MRRATVFHCRSSPYSLKMRPNSCSDAMLTMCAAVRSLRWSMRISSGPSAEKAKPRSGWSSCMEDTPRSSRMPSTRPNTSASVKTCFRSLHQPQSAVLASSIAGLCCVSLSYHWISASWCQPHVRKDALQRSAHKELQLEWNWAPNLAKVTTLPTPMHSVLHQIEPVFVVLANFGSHLAARSMRASRGTAAHPLHNSNLIPAQAP